MDTTIEDKELGVICVRMSIRAKRFTFRMRKGNIHATVPWGATERRIKQAMDELRPRLRSMRAKFTPVQIRPGYRIEADLFELKVTEGTYERFLARSEPGKTEILCPPGVDYGDGAVQLWLRKAITEALRKHAAVVLPPRLYMLAGKHALTYKSVRINTGTGRWGSCSARGSINLSCFLLLLPAHLIDYVLLHELTHTLEMNHGERFQRLLDGYTGGRARSLRRELKDYPIQFVFV